MAAPLLAHIAAKSPRQVTIANRSLPRAQALASHFGAEAIELAEGVSRLAEFDVVVACTSSAVPVLGLGAVERAVKARRRRPMLMIDLAVPRDIEPEVGELPDVYLHTIDDLSKLVQANGEKRAAAVGQAETIIEAGVQEFQRWLDTRQTVPMIQALQRQAETWRATELQRARKLLAKGDDIETVLEALSRGLTQKMLHGPMAGLQSSEGPRARRAQRFTLAPLPALPDACQGGLTFRFGKPDRRRSPVSPSRTA